MWEGALGVLVQALTTSRLSATASSAGAQGAADLAVRGRNACRDLTRRLAKESALPPVFRFEVPLCNPADGQGTYATQPLLLPHEVYGALSKGHKLSLCAAAHAAMCPSERRAFEAFCNSHNLEFQSCLPLAVHGDGVPFTKSDSILCYTTSVAGVAQSDRVLITGVPKSSFCPCGCRGAMPSGKRSRFPVDCVCSTPIPRVPLTSDAARVPHVPRLS